MKSNLVTLSALLTLLAGCATSGVPLENVHAAPIATQRVASLDQVAQAITRAGASLGWQMRRIGPDDIYGVLGLYEARAAIRVHFTTHFYDITYRNSRHLNARGDRIDRRYNQWIQSLDQQIQFQIQCLSGSSCRPAPKPPGP